MTADTNLPRQIWHFIIHLRWHYQVFILSGGYLLGGFFQDGMCWPGYLAQFLNVHLLLFGGATAYNSYWDKDEGPVGGLRNPPVMKDWMRPASLLIQFAGLLIAINAGYLFAAVYVISMIFFWLYSTPLARWKSRPVLSIVAIGISTGTNSFLLGYLAAGGLPAGWSEILAAVGVALVILSLYPLSQVYQIDEDRERGDLTFAVKYGKKAVYRFYITAYISGVLLISFALYDTAVWLGAGFAVVGLAAGITVWMLLKGLRARSDDYNRVMRIKYVTSLAFVAALIAGLIFKHTPIGIVW